MIQRLRAKHWNAKCAKNIRKVRKESLEQTEVDLFDALLRQPARPCKPALGGGFQLSDTATLPLCLTRQGCSCARCRRPIIGHAFAAISKNAENDRAAWGEEDGQDIAEYAVMLSVILVIVLSTIQLIGSNAGTVFSSVGSAIQ